MRPPTAPSRALQENPQAPRRRYRVADSFCCLPRSVVFRALRGCPANCMPSVFRGPYLRTGIAQSRHQVFLIDQRPLVGCLQCELQLPVVIADSDKSRAEAQGILPQPPDMAVIGDTEIGGKLAHGIRAPEAFDSWIIGDRSVSSSTTALQAIIQGKPTPIRRLSVTLATLLSAHPE